VVHRTVVSSVVRSNASGTPKIGSVREVRTVAAASTRSAPGAVAMVWGTVSSQVTRS
jgi:hypothetical protein